MISIALIVALGIKSSSQREVLGIEVGDNGDKAFWTAFLRHTRERGLSGVKVVISDAHAGLKKAIARCCQGSGWQGCLVHCARNILVKVPKGNQDMVSAALRSVFVQIKAQARSSSGVGNHDAKREVPRFSRLDGACQEGPLDFRSITPDH